MIHFTSPKRAVAAGVVLLASTLMASGRQVVPVGSITGQILSRGGTPAARIRVGAQTASSAASPVVSSTMTDAAGRFQLNIPPGRYHVIAGSFDTPLYFPGVLESTTARAVTVASGAVIAEIDFQWPSVLRFGTLASRALDRDVAEIELLLQAPGKLWLLDNTGNPSRDFLSAFLLPDSLAAGLRRGSVFRVRNRQPMVPEPGEWRTVDTGGNYAQVAVPGRTLDEMIGDQDTMSPFRVTGDFSDADLIGIVSFVRNPVGQNSEEFRNPRGPGSRSLNRPIISVTRQPEGVVVVRHLGAVFQSATLQKKGQSWIIVSSVTFQV